MKKKSQPYLESEKELFKQAIKSLRGMRLMAKETCRSGAVIEDLQDYKNALSTEDLLSRAVKEINEVPENLGSFPQSDKVPKSVPDIRIIIINCGD